MKGGPVLGIETTGRLLSVGVVAGAGDERLLGEMTIQAERRHARELLPAVDALVGRLDLRGQDLAGIGVSVGPGSYTGIRVGVATAQALALGWGVPAVGVNTLTAVAAGLQARAGTVQVVVDARRGRVYTARFRVAPGALPERLTPDRVVPRAKLGSLVDQDALVSVEDAGLTWADRPLPPVLGVPRAAMVAWVAARLLAEGGEVGDPLALAPLYLRGEEEDGLAEPAGA